MTGGLPGDNLADVTDDGVRRTPGWLVVAAMVLACAPIVALGQFANLARVDDVDATFFAYYGKRIVAGQRLYADLWDNKPPGIFWVDAVGWWIAGGRYWGVAALVSAATVGTISLFFLTARRIFGLATAAIGTVMAALYVHQYYYHVGANRPSTFYVLFELAVLYFYCRAFDREGRTRWAMFLAGVCAACAVGFRQTAFAVSAAIVVHQVYLSLSRRQSVGELLGWLLPFAAGCVSAAGVVVLVLWWTSDLWWAWHGVVLSNIGYLTHSKQSSVLPRELFHWEDHLAALGLPLVLAAAAVIHAVATRVYVKSPSHWPGRQLGGPPGVLLLLIVCVPIAVYLAVIGPHRAHHYYGIALAPLVMLATHGVWLLMRRGGEDRGPRYYVILATLWFVYMAAPVAKLQVRGAMKAHFERFDDRSVDRWAKTVAAVEAHTDPDDTLFSMRYLPFVYARTDRAQAHRYLLETLIDQWREAAQPLVDEVVRDLKADPPGAIIASDHELEQMERGGEKVYVDYGDFPDWIRGHYVRAPSPENSNLWVRVD